MSRIYYPVRYRLDYKERWLLWYTLGEGEGDEPDSVVVDENGKMLVFRSRQSLMAYAHAEELALAAENESAFFNLDNVVKWLGRKRPAELNCVEFLNAWNLLADVSASVGGSFDPDKARTRQIYHKLFWGNNLPAVTPAGKHYTPQWPGRESRVIRKVLREGLFLFRECAIQVRAG